MKRRILIIIPNLGRGGAQQVFRQQIHYLSNNFDVKGCVFNWDGSFEEDRMLPVITLNIPGGRNWLLKIWFFYKRILSIRNIKRKLSIDIAISHLEGADYVNLLSFTKKCKAVCWIHGTKKYDLNINGFSGIIRSKLLMPLLYKKADAIVTVSKGLELELTKEIMDIECQTSTIYNGLNLERIDKLSTESIQTDYLSLFDQPNIMITHCRLSRQKNLNALLNVFNQLRKSVDVRLIILGDGELRDQLVDLGNELDLRIWSCWYDKSPNNEYDVYFMGQQSNPFNLLKKATLFVMTSSWEGFPLALCEALACGLPVVVTDCFTGPREILFNELTAPQPVSIPVKSQLGYLMPLLDASDNSSIQLWSDHLRQMFESEYFNSYNRVDSIERVRHFQISDSIDQTIKLLDSIE